MSKTNNIYIKKAKRKRRIKKIIFIFVLLVIAFVIVAFKTKVFYISNIKITGDNLLTKNYVEEKTNYLNNTNLITMDKEKIEKKLKENPYIKTVNISRKYPKTLIINIKEAKGLFYIKNNNEYAIISSDLVYLENVPSIDNKNLIEIQGIDVSESNIGNSVSKSSKIKELLDELYKEQNVIQNNKEDFAIKSVNVQDMNNITLYLNDIKVLLGNYKETRDRMSDAILVYKSKLPKEYINVSFDGSPDFK